MNIPAALRDFFFRYGSPFTLAGEEFYGILSPRGRESPDYRKIRSGELGAGVYGSVMLMAPPDAPLQKGGRLEFQGTGYVIQSAEDYFVAGEPVYRWAMLEPVAEREPPA